MRPTFYMLHLYLTLTLLCIVGFVSFLRYGSLDFTAHLSILKSSYFIAPAGNNTKNSTSTKESVPEASASWVQALGHRLKDSVYGSLHNTEKVCDMDACVDYSRCSLTRPFSFYLYPQGWLDKASKHTNTLTTLFQTFLHNENREKDPNSACIYVALVDLCHSKQTMDFNGKGFHQDGKNHIFWTHCSVETATAADFPIPTSSMLARESFDSKFRPNFDIVVSHWESVPMDFHDIWSNLPQLFPITRKNRACFASCYKTTSLPAYLELRNQGHRLHYTFIKDTQCQNQTLRRKILQKSIFSVIIQPLEPVGTSSGASSVNRQIYESLREATIPVIVGSTFSAPFQEVLEWSKVIITIPLGRLKDLPILLDAISDTEILEFKKQGRLFLEKYVGSLESIVQTFLATLRTRFGLAPRPFGSVDCAHVHDDRSERNASSKSIITYLHNYSVNYERKYEAWNEVFQPFKMYPTTPWEQDVGLQSSGRLFKEDFNVSKLGRQGGSRVEMFEKFTIVIETYKRHKLVVKCLKRLNKIKFLHKVLIIWNELNPPPKSMEWPNISAPIVVIFPRRNSMNNRFIPFDEIETEGVFVLDDDMEFSQDELAYGFHVWTENRDRLVGYMGRWHSWDEGKKSWKYHWSTNCKISIVLAGAAFIHKIYLYKYTFEMPAIIRRTVDLKTNCDDLAMNFLIAHVSKKPPIKLTNKKDFTLWGGGGGISSRGGYLRARHECLNFLYRVYGYMPLHFTVSRADSVLYNTKKACFKKV